MLWDVRRLGTAINSPSHHSDHGEASLTAASDSKGNESAALADAELASRGGYEAQGEEEEEAERGGKREPFTTEGERGEDERRARAANAHRSAIPS